MIFAVVAILVLSSTPAQPAPPRSTAEVEHYFEGVWANWCSTAPEAGNGLAIFIRQPGREGLTLISINRSGGAFSSSLTEVRLDKLNPNHTVSVRFIHGADAINTTEIDVSQLDRYSIVSSISQTGRYSTKDGIIVATNKPRPAYRRCSNAVVSP